MIYLDNAATTLKKPEQVIDAVVYAMGNFGNASRGAHGYSLDASRMIFGTRQKIADMFGCPGADHVIFTSNATESLNMAINGIISPGDRVITTDLEHNSVLRPLYRLENESHISLGFVPSDRKGCLRLSDFEKLVTDRTKAVVCTHASNLTGNIVDIAEIGKIARRHGALFIVDASQTAGFVNINMEKMNIDVLCFSGHKGLMGPQGTGALLVRDGIEIRPFKTGGTGVQSYEKSQPAEYPVRLEAGTLNSHGIAGLSAALDFISATGIDKIEQKENRLLRRFYEQVSGVRGVTVYGDFSSSLHAPVAALNIRSVDSGEISDCLFREYSIATRPGAHCAPRMHEALGTREQGAVRFSFSWFNTEEEIDIAADAVKEIAAKY
ncbi:MAG TPA: aminotransferase class V-fold PLP-dependent enzyme [Lachnospiraceae bacterium]|nr:aminotransferase class V-fold PLP-dependent enzyme [Lachnospiraceae bacterium]